ncbi:MAG: nucleotidyltransferase family protein, partial [Firmicutes bacterium]|nr:nucleotidyltransferase family protein [Bacillota bacterium]
EQLFFLPPQGGLLENLDAGLYSLSDASRVLVVTGDIPLLTPSVVEGFIRLCEDQGAEAYYPVVPRSTMEEALPGVKRTYVRLRDGSFTGGNVGLVDPAAVKRCLNRARDFVRLRKKPFRLAMVVGIGFLVRFVLGCLSLREAEEKVSKILGIKGRVVVTPFPEIGMDVDKPSDLEIAETALAIRPKSTA